MAEHAFDIHLEFDLFKLAEQHDPTQVIAEASRHAAESLCAEYAIRLRHPDPREVVARRAVEPDTGQDVLLVATRWVADGPPRVG